MKTRVLLFLLAIIPSFVSAETVFIYTVSEGTESTLKDSVPYLEDGIMETMFDAGHIVFNDSSTKPVRKKGLDTYKEPEDFLTAKKGGATFLMEISVHYRIEEDKEIPVSADYRLFNVISGKLLKDGTSVFENDSDDTKPYEKKLEDMGKRMAGSILGFI